MKICVGVTLWWQLASWAAVVVCCLHVGGAVAPAQEAGNSLNSVADKVLSSVVQVRNGDRECCFGTLVAGGYVVTKLSELSGRLTCVAADGTSAPGVIVAYSKKLDLALVRVDAGDAERSFGQPVDFIDRLPVEAGDVLLSVGDSSTPLAVGVATVAPQVIAIKQPNCRDCVDLGTTVAAEPSTRQVLGHSSNQATGTIEFVTGVQVERVYPRTVGEQVGLLKDDLLVSINDRPIYDSVSLGQSAAGLRVGQLLRARVIRAGQRKELAWTIESFSSRVFHDRWGGGPFSERRFGFDEVIIHDSLIRPDQCGGPLVDLDGNFVGINVARSLRVATFAVSADRIREFLESVRPSLLR